MRKFIFIVFIVICSSNSLSAQDIIILQNGEEISAKVLEVNPTEIKYKRFGSERPIYSIEKFRIFMIKYEDGYTDLFNQENIRYENKSQYENNQVRSNLPKYLPYSFGFDLSMGYIGFDSGIQFTRNFTPYIGWDVLKLKFSVYDEDEDDYHYYYKNQEGISLLSGVRGSTPRFGRNKTSHVYSAFRLGICYYSRDHEYEHYSYRGGDYYHDIKTDEGFSGSLEWDLGIHLSHMFFYTRVSVVDDIPFIGIGIGADFGRLVEVKTKKITFNGQMH